jgi:hypothetical protein
MKPELFGLRLHPAVGIVEQAIRISMPIWLRPWRRVLAQGVVEHLFPSRAGKYLTYAAAAAKVGLVNGGRRG